MPPVRERYAALKALMRGEDEPAAAPDEVPIPAPPEVPIPSPREVGHRIKTARERLGIPRDRAARMLGMHRLTYLRLENQPADKRWYPSYPTLFRLVERLGVTTEELFAPGSGEDETDDP
jgi:DNA-binding XRE family transcriptional regulator